MKKIKKYQCVKQAITLNKQFSSVPNYNFEKPLDSAGNFFEKSTKIFKKNPRFKNSAVVCMLKGMIAKSSSNKKNIYLEEKRMDFFRYLRTL